MVRTLRASCPRQAAKKPLPVPTPVGAEGDTIHVAFPVEYQGVTYGRAHYGLSSAFLQDARDTLFEQSLTIALLEITMAFLLLLATGYWLTRDFAALANASTRLAAGDHVTPLSVEAA